MCSEALAWLGLFYSVCSVTELQLASGTGLLLRFGAGEALRRVAWMLGGGGVSGWVGTSPLNRHFLQPAEAGKGVRNRQRDSLVTPF